MKWCKECEQHPAGHEELCKECFHEKHPTKCEVCGKETSMSVIDFPKQHKATICVECLEFI